MIFNASCLPKKASMFVFLVGGGTCGCALAARLSEIADWKILLVEAGGEQPSKVKIPWFHLWLTDSPLDWRYVTEPQNNAMWAFEQQVCLKLCCWVDSRDIILISKDHLHNDLSSHDSLAHFLFVQGPKSNEKWGQTKTKTNIQYTYQSFLISILHSV